MERSRTDMMRERRRKRRIRLAAINLCLLAAIAAVLVWNQAQSGDSGEVAAENPSSQAEKEPAQDQGDDSASEQDRQEEESSASAPVEEPEGTEEPKVSDQGKVRLAFVGDVLLGEYVGTLMKQHGFDYPYQQVKPLLQDADLTAANLETSITGEREKPGVKQYEFRSAAESMPAFTEAGFDLVSLANNHTLDFGPEGLRDTIKHLRDNNLKYVGAGENADEAYAPVYIEENGMTIAFLGFSRVIPFAEWKAGKNVLGLAETYNHTRPVEEIKAAKERADLVVVMVHWGEERKLEADSKKQTGLGRRYIDAGADLVIGSHPHVLQGIESYKEKWIVYSLGNFIFTKAKDPLTYDSGVLYADCKETGECSLQLVPVNADTPQPAPMEADEAAKVLERVSSLSVNARLNETGFIEKR